MHVDSLRCRVEGVKLHQTNRPTDVCTVMPYQCPSTGDMIVLDGRHARVFAYYNLHPIHITSIHVVRPFRAHSTVYNPQAMTPAPHTDWHFTHRSLDRQGNPPRYHRHCRNLAPNRHSSDLGVPEPRGMSSAGGPAFAQGPSHGRTHTHACVAQAAPPGRRSPVCRLPKRRPSLRAARPSSTTTMVTPTALERLRPPSNHR